MPLRKRIGRAVGRFSLKGGAATGRALGRLGTNPVVAGTVIGASALAGVGSAVLDTEGPFPAVQESLYGTPNALRASIRGGIKSGLGSGDSDVPGPANYYYGQPVDVVGMNRRRQMSGSTTPVPGESVFGMWNMRR